MSAPTDYQVIAELAEAFPDKGEAVKLVERAGLGVSRQPSWQARSADLFWSEVFRLYRNGAVVGGPATLLREAHLALPGNRVIAAAASAAGVADARVAEPVTMSSAAGTPDAVGADKPPPRMVRSTGADAPAASLSDVNFFISYTHADTRWAEWIAWQLEEAGYSVYIQAWDFVAGSNLMNMMARGIQRADRTILVISHSYLNSVWARTEWQMALQRDPDGIRSKVLPVRVENCLLPEPLKAVQLVDLFGREPEVAKNLLLGAAKGTIAGRQRPTTPPAFPGGV